jgi:gustatory receptor
VLDLKTNHITNDISSIQSNFVDEVYFWFNFTFILFKTLCVYIYSAEIYEESRKPLIVLKAIPKEGWCFETKRLRHEISSDDVSLTGMDFFTLNRQLVLSVCGTIVTYELVSMSF